MRDIINDFLTFLSFFTDNTDANSEKDFFTKMRFYLIAKYPKIGTEKIDNVISFIETISEGGKTCQKIEELTKAKIRKDEKALVDCLHLTKELDLQRNV